MRRIAAAVPTGTNKSGIEFCQHEDCPYPSRR